VGGGGSEPLEELLARERDCIAPRVAAADLDDVMASGALVVDIRPVEQRTRDGELPGAVVVDRNVLEWRLTPSSPHRIAAVVSDDQVVVIVCNEGYSSSLAAATLRRLGLRGVTDLDGGFQAWAARHRGG
jgi:rhodanese-related sulfurtransferase